MTDLMHDLTAVNPKPKPAPTPGGMGLKKKTSRPVSNVDAAGVFKGTVCSEPCIGENIPGHECDGPLQAMHVVPKQTLKRRGLLHLVYDPQNGVAGCYRIHRRHDSGTEKIPRTMLPHRCVLFAIEHHLLDDLHRHWPAAA